MELAPGDAGQRQERVDELAHLARVREDLLQPVLTLGVELVLVLIEEHLREAVHSPEGRAQVVGDRVAERLELAVGELERRLGQFSRADISNHARNQGPFVGLERPEADFDRKLGAVLAPTLELEPGAHLAHARRGPIPRAVRHVLGPSALREQGFDGLSLELLPFVAEELFGLRIDEHDLAAGVDDHDRVGRGLQERSESLFRGPSSGSLAHRRFACAERLVRAHLVVDVGGGPYPLRDSPLRVANR